jgi:hypothetical protein
MKKIHNDFPSPAELVPDIPERIDWAIRRAMSGAPDNRPASCREFIEDLTGTSLKQSNVGVGEVPKDIWYLVYKDENNETHTVKGSTEGIRKALREGLLGDANNIVACRTKQGPFLGLTNYGEFRDLLIEPAPMPPKTAIQTSTPAKASSISTRQPTSPEPEESVQYPETTTDEHQPTSKIRQPKAPHLQLNDEESPRGSRGLDWRIIVGMLVVALLTALGTILLMKFGM